MVYRIRYFFLFLFGAAIFLTHYVFSGQAIYGDGIDYWVYLPSVYFDHDINFENEYRHFYGPDNNNSINPKLVEKIQKTRITSIGKTDNPHPPGSAIVWFPAFIFADLLSTLLKLPRNGFADAYQIFAGVWSVVMVTFGLIINEKIAYKFIKDDKISFLATVAVFYATPLLYYGSYDVLNSHFASFTLTSIFWYLLFFAKSNLKTSIMTGCVIGLATLIRVQEALIFFPLFVYTTLKKSFSFRNFSTTSLVFLFLITPIFIIWQFLYGKPYPETYFVMGVENRFKFGSLIDPLTGLFSRTPFLLVSFIGAIKFSKKHKRVFWVMFLYFVLQYLVITYHGGWDAAAYGGRMYISTFLLFTILIAYLLKMIKDRWNYKYALVTVCLFSIINILSITSFVLFEKQVNSGKKRGLEEHSQEKLEQIINSFF